MQIVGVMKDFNYNSLHKEIKPLELDYEATVRLSGQDDRVGEQYNYKSVLSQMETIWKRNLAGCAF